MYFPCIPYKSLIILNRILFIFHLYPWQHKQLSSIALQYLSCFSHVPEVVDDGKGGGERRLEEGTQQLSEELMNHVESLRNTLDNMSNR